MIIDDQAHTIQTLTVYGSECNEQHISYIPVHEVYINILKHACHCSLISSLTFVHRALPPCKSNQFKHLQQYSCETNVYEIAHKLMLLCKAIGLVMINELHSTRCANRFHQAATFYFCRIGIHNQHVTNSIHKFSIYHVLFIQYPTLVETEALHYSSVHR